MFPDDKCGCACHPRPWSDGQLPYGQKEQEIQNPEEVKTSGWQYPRYEMSTGDWLPRSIVGTSPEIDPSTQWTVLPELGTYKRIRAVFKSEDRAKEDADILRRMETSRFVQFTALGCARLIEEKLYMRMATILATSKTMEGFSFHEDNCKDHRETGGDVVAAAFLRAIRKNPHHRMKVVSIQCKSMTAKILPHVTEFINANICIRHLEFNLGREGKTETPEKEKESGTDNKEECDEKKTGQFDLDRENCRLLQALRTDKLITSLTIREDVPLLSDVVKKQIIANNDANRIKFNKSIGNGGLAHVIKGWHYINLAVDHASIPRNSTPLALPTSDVKDDKHVSASMPDAAPTPTSTPQQGISGKVFAQFCRDLTVAVATGTTAKLIPGYNC